MKRKFLIIILMIAFLYIASYIFVRQTYTEIWEKNKMAYVIFPENKILYYMYRPLSLIDNKITEMEIHIGQHQ